MKDKIKILIFKISDRLIEIEKNQFYKVKSLFCL